MDNFLIDTHLHTSEVSPCGKMSAKELVIRYHEKGYNGLIITDHFSSNVIRRGRSKRRIDNFLLGYRKAKEYGMKVDMAVFLGIELTLAMDATVDLLIYGIDETFLYDQSDLFIHTPRIARQLVKERFPESIIVQAHPFREYATRFPVDLLDGVEVVNGNPRHEANNLRAFDYATEHALLMTSGSDTHQPEDIGCGGMIFDHTINSIEEFITALRGKPAPGLIGRNA